MCRHGDTVDLLVMMPPHLSYTGEARVARKAIDRCIAELVTTLNNNGFLTANSCCGHGKTDGSIILHDGTELVIKWPSSTTTSADQ